MQDTERAIYPVQLTPKPQQKRSSIALFVNLCALACSTLFFLATVQAFWFSVALAQTVTDEDNQGLTPPAGATVSQTNVDRDALLEEVQQLEQEYELLYSSNGTGITILSGSDEAVDLAERILEIYRQILPANLNHEFPGGSNVVRGWNPEDVLTFAKALDRLAKEYIIRAVRANNDFLYKHAVSIYEELWSFLSTQTSGLSIQTGVSVAEYAEAIAGIYHSNGFIFAWLNKHDVAELWYDKAEFWYRDLIFHQTIQGLPIQDDYALDYLVRRYTSRGAYEVAHLLLNEVLEHNRKVLKNDDPELADTLGNIAHFYRANGQTTQAIELYEESLEILRRSQATGKFQVDGSTIANFLNNLAVVLQDVGRYGEIEELLEEAVSLLRQEELTDSNKPIYANLLNSLANHYRLQERLDEALPLFQESLELNRQQPITLNNLALLYWGQGRYDQAEELLQEALSLVREQGGSSTAFPQQELIVILKNLARLYIYQKRSTEAEPLLVEVYEKLQSYPHVHSNFISFFYIASELYIQQENISEGIDLRSYSSEIQEQNIRQILAAGNEEQRRDYLSKLPINISSAVSFHLNRFPDELQAAQLAFTAVLRQKGRLLDASADTLQILCHHLQYIPDIYQLCDKLRRVRTQISNHSYANQRGEVPNETSAGLEQLKAEEQQLEASLGEWLATLERPEVPDLFQRICSTVRVDLQGRFLSEIPTFTQDQCQDQQTGVEKLQEEQRSRVEAIRSQQQIATIDNVQRQIPDDTALVELVYYQPFEDAGFEVGWRPRYVAYILHPQGDPQWVDLGDAATIDRLVNQFRDSLRTRDPDIKEIARELDAKVMQPVRSLLGNSKHILLSPDGQLNLIPFAALVDESDRYLVENYTITYLTSGRDLLKLQNDVPSRQPPVILANPDYTNPGNPNPVAIATTNSRPSDQVASTRSSNQRSMDLTTLKFDLLPGTDLEQQAIAPLLPNATVLTGAQATENVVKQLQAPSILHIATHGFFLQDIACVPILNSRGGDAAIGVRPLNNGEPCVPTPQNTENPLMRSGLALAGFNPRQSGDQDGVLTAAEVAGLNLYGTKLVVLSACETGLGNVANGEGVYGLRRSFVMAGAESQMMSLWKVDDYGTSSLMSRYYQKLRDRTGRSEALQQVQLEMLQSGNYQHPYYWAGFIFSGDWTAIEDL
ncbi:CHAT domain-containing tetratricopeptide repeat protein [Leptolyngbya ohadii]|uniref:CHAT domain-containing tetratricopeptide repeat protein n=1 Tax=Leptolyngbya ohadii TaxID=1962290 RepID=UPI000B5A1AB9|nr:CHAT domain-containing protein [Leptolyngbya ohadii]